jgi:hypothetical protein
MFVPLRVFFESLGSELFDLNPELTVELFV